MSYFKVCENWDWKPFDYTWYLKTTSRTLKMRMKIVQWCKFYINIYWEVEKVSWISTRRTTMPQALIGNSTFFLLNNSTQWRCYKTYFSQSLEAVRETTICIFQNNKKICEKIYIQCAIKLNRRSIDFITVSFHQF